MGKGKATRRRFDSATHAWDIVVHGGIRRMVAYSAAADRTGGSGGSSGGRRRPLVLGQVTGRNSGGLGVLLG
jgi:hypothetical protein